MEMAGRKRTAPATHPEDNPMTTTFTTTPEGIAYRTEMAERVLFAWACGDIGAREVRDRLQRMGVRLLDRLNPNGLPTVDATMDGVADVVTFTF